jgi:hypothetical protein
MRKNLVSVGAIVDKGNLVIFSDSHCWIVDKQEKFKFIASGYRDHKNGLYRFGKDFEANSLEFRDKSTLWHKRFGHLSYSGLHHLSVNQWVTGMPTIATVRRVCEQ